MPKIVVDRKEKSTQAPSRVKPRRFSCQRSKLFLAQEIGSAFSSLKKMNFRSFDEFWPFYVSQHSKPATRRWHFAGTLLSIVFLIYSAVFNWWCLFLVPFSGYGLAWYSHLFVEGNVPATFGHPVWSLLCDYKMFGLMLMGKMDREIKRLGKRPILNGF